jgi:hypothetical protein
VVKLIRSKRITIYFVTQNPMNISSGVLTQLALKTQNASSAFIANDRQSI